MIKKMVGWGIFFLIIAMLVFIAALFLTPSFTYACSQELLKCVEDAYPLPMGSRLWQTLVCTYHNVVCVLGGLFV